MERIDNKCSATTSYLSLPYPQRSRRWRRYFLLSLVLTLAIGPAGQDRDLPIIPIHITLITENKKAIRAFTPEAFKWIAGTLDYEFRGEAGNFLARFEIRTVTPLAVARQLAPDLVGQQDHRAINKIIGTIVKSPLFHRDKLNIFVYHSKAGNMLSNAGYYCSAETIAGRRQTECFFRILLHWKALAARNRHVLVHEAGHAFGLRHVHANAALDSPELNMMYSDQDAVRLPAGETGYYFTASQVKTVKAHITMMQETIQKYATMAGK